VGTPDFEKTIIATVVHDALCQFHHAPYFPISRSQGDLIFRDIMAMRRFILSKIYYMGVCIGTNVGIGGGSGPCKSILTHL
jgi:hypothetical protein